MNDIATATLHIPAMSEMAINNVRQLEAYSLQVPQAEIGTQHIIHGGMYVRTILIPAGVMLTGALIKIATILIVCGDVIVYVGDKSIDMRGYNVLPASANRKQAFVARSDTYLTMIFTSGAARVEDAENEFTSDAIHLMSRKPGAINIITVTGE